MYCTSLKYLFLCRDSKQYTTVHCAIHFCTRTPRTALFLKPATYIVADPNQQSTAASRSFPAEKVLTGNWDFFEANGPWGEDPSLVSM